MIIQIQYRVFYNAQLCNTSIDLNMKPKFNISNIGAAFFNYLNNSNFRIMKCYKVVIDTTIIFENNGIIII